MDATIRETAKSMNEMEDLLFRMLVNSNWGLELLSFDEPCVIRSLKSRTQLLVPTVRMMVLLSPPFPIETFTCVTQDFVRFGCAHDQGLV